MASPLTQLSLLSISPKIMKCTVHGKTWLRRICLKGYRLVRRTIYNQSLNPELNHCGLTLCSYWCRNNFYCICRLNYYLYPIWNSSCYIVLSWKLCFLKYVSFLWSLNEIFFNCIAISWLKIGKFCKIIKCAIRLIFHGFLVYKYQDYVSSVHVQAAVRRKYGRILTTWSEWARVIQTKIHITLNLLVGKISAPYLPIRYWILQHEALWYCNSTFTWQYKAEFVEQSCVLVPL